MTQNASDVEIANQGFAAFRQDLNDVLEDITTLHSGTAAPSTTYANQWWYETDTDKLYIRNEDNDAWIEILTLDQANDHLASLGASITLDSAGAVTLQYNGSAKLATTNTGIDVTGTVTADRAAIYSGVLSEQSQIRFGYNSDNHWSIGRENATTGDLFIESSTSGTDTTRMVISASGNLGIGTDSPAHELTVQNSTSAPTIRVHADTTSSPTPSIELMRGTNDTFGSDNYSDYRIKSTSGHLTFEHGANGSTDERMRIDNLGSLLVGTTTDNFNTGLSGARLMAAGHIISRSDNINYFLKEGTGTLQEFRYFSSGTATSGTTVGTIVITTSSTSYNTSSDYRLKENVTGITDGIERVKQLNPSRFNFIADADTTVDGFLAHEAATVVPEAVTGEKDAMRDEEYEVTPAVLDDDGNVVTEAVMGTRSVPDYQGIDQAKLVPLLTAALQEAITKIEDLETRVAALEAE